jgi:hypothetical protein
MPKIALAAAILIFTAAPALAYNRATHMVAGAKPLLPMSATEQCRVGQSTSAALPPILHLCPFFAISRSNTMPKKSKKTKPEAEVVETTPADAAPAEAKPVRGEKTKAIKAALKAHKDKSPKEIAEIVTAAGIPTTAGQVSNVKSILASKRKTKAKAAPAAEEAAGPVVAKDAVSVALLVKAKKLVQELGGVKEAKIALNALAQLMD